MPRITSIKAVRRHFSREQRRWTTIDEELTLPANHSMNYQEAIRALLSRYDITDVNIGFKNGDMDVWQRPPNLPVAGTGR